VVIVVAVLAGAGLVIAGFVTRGGGDDVVLDVDVDVVDVTPSTVPPRIDVDPPRVATVDTIAPDIAPDIAPRVTVSPLVAQLGPRLSARPDEVGPRPVPIGLQLETIDVSRFPIRPVGLEPDGQLEIPDETEIGWYRYGATAGQEGATVLAAHVSWNRTTGPFARLGSVEPGEQVEVVLDDGSVRRYVVTERAIYGKLELPIDRIWRTSGDETLVLVTCGGDYNPEIRRYRQNIVVYAVPVA